MKRCSRCGKRKNENAFYSDRGKKDKLMCACKTCINAQNKINNKERLKTFKNWAEKNSDRKLYNVRKQNSKKRKGGHIVWNLTFEWFCTNIIGKPCHWCGGQQYGGIDRVDNNVGYEPENCVPCCQRCNTIKSNMNLVELKMHLEKMLNMLNTSI